MSNPQDKPEVPLDDVMIAMDVVDTLRHDDRIVQRELNDEARRADLIKRLREIYQSQGMDVPDDILEEGVRALEQDRFVYKPPADGIKSRLARLYVSRLAWGKYVGGALAGIALIFAINYFVYERPSRVAAENQRIELTDKLPNRLRKLSADIASETDDDAIAQSADAIARSGLNAAASGDSKAAHAAETELQSLLDELRRAYTIRIVSRTGQLSGLWRIPEANPDTYNYYLVVEAIGPSNEPLTLSIMNEETGKRDRVQMWAQRVPRAVLEAVQADKRDDGIIQNAVVGNKKRGQLEPKWKIDVSGGAITKW